MIERLDAIVIEQLVTADDAIEDWRDIVPEDVAEVERNYAKLNIAKNPNLLNLKGKFIKKKGS